MLIPPPKMMPSAWAERYRTIESSARSGKWRNDNAPYLSGIMDACLTPGVNDVVVMKSAQGGGSEAFRNVIGCIAHTLPSPCLLVLADEKTAKRIMKRRIVPMFRDTPVLRDLASRSAYDSTSYEIELANRFNIRIGWSGSAASLASDPIRVAIMDEVDKYDDFTGADGSPIELARVRTLTWGDRALRIYLSSPTTTDGYIARLHDGSALKVYFRVPCPHCGAFQRLAFARVKWKLPDGLSVPMQAEMLRSTRAVWYECEACTEPIRDRQREAMIRRGVWASDETAQATGFAERAAAATPGAVLDPIGFGAGRRIAFHFSSLYALWTPWHETASEFIKSKDDPSSLYAFQTSWLGEPWQERIAKPERAKLDAKAGAASLPAGIVPAWATCLLATADRQRDRLYYVVRAHGPCGRSHLVAHGVVPFSNSDYSDLRRVTLDCGFQVEGSGERINPLKLGIDSGDEAQDVYRFCETEPERIYPLKGASKPQSSRVKMSRVFPKSATGPASPLSLYIFAPNTFKDEVAQAMAAPPGPDGTEQWSLNQGADADYLRQLCAEHKVVKRKGEQRLLVWVPVAAGIDNHYWDCEVMQCAMAVIVHASQFTEPFGAPASAAPAPIPQSRDDQARERRDIWAQRPRIGGRYR